MSLMPIGHEFRMHDSEDDEFGDAQLKHIERKNMATDYTNAWYERIMAREGLTTPKQNVAAGSRIDGARVSAPRTCTTPKPLVQARKQNVRWAPPSNDFDYLFKLACTIIDQIEQETDNDYDRLRAVLATMDKTPLKIVAILDAVLESGKVSVEWLRARFPMGLIEAAALLTTTEDPTKIGTFLRQVKANPLAKAVALAYINWSLANTQREMTQSVKALFYMQLEYLNS